MKKSIMLEILGSHIFIDFDTLRRCTSTCCENKIEVILNGVVVTDYKLDRLRLKLSNTTHFTKYYVFVERCI